MTGVSLRNVLGHAKRLRIALRAAEPLCVLRRVPERSPRPAPGFPAFTALRSAWAEIVADRDTYPGCCFALCAKGASLWGGWATWSNCCSAPVAFLERFPSRNYPRRTCANTRSCYTCNCCFRAGWNSPLAVNRAVPQGRRGAGEVPATEPMSPRPVCALVRMPAELVRSQYQRLESG